MESCWDRLGIVFGPFENILGYWNLRAFFESTLLASSDFLWLPLASFGFLWIPLAFLAFFGFFGYLWVPLSFLGFFEFLIENFALDYQ